MEAQTARRRLVTSSSASWHSAAWVSCCRAAVSRARGVLPFELRLYRLRAAHRAATKSPPGRSIVRRRPVASGVFAVSAVAVGLAAFFYLHPYYYTPKSIGVVPGVDAAVTGSPKTPGNSVPGAAIGKPTGVVIPSLGVTAPVVPKGLAANGTLAIPSNPQILAWWKYGAAPNQAQGTVVIAGHVDTYEAGAGALYHLSNVQLGATVLLRTTAGVVRYRVVARHTYLKANLPESVFARDGTARLVLITCGGPFNWSTRHYADNIVAYALPVRGTTPSYATAHVGPTLVRLDAVDSTMISRARGYLGSPAPKRGHGRLFVWSSPVEQGFSMSGLAFPLDVAFIDRSTVVGVFKMAPCPSATNCKIYVPNHPYTSAVQASPGSFAGVRVGDSFALSAAPPRETIVARAA